MVGGQTYNMTIETQSSLGSETPFLSMYLKNYILTMNPLLSKMSWRFVVYPHITPDLPPPIPVES